jgi:hypothetical protein
MRPILKFVAVGALGCASLLALAAVARASEIHMKHDGGHAPAYAHRVDDRHDRDDRPFERRYRHNLAGYLAGAAIGAAAGAGYEHEGGYEHAGYEHEEAPPEQSYGERYAAEPAAPEYYSHEDAEHVVLYHSVTHDYTVPVHTYRTVTHTHYVPVTTYRPVTTETQVPVTTYETVQRTEQVPTYYRVVHHHGCGCGL